MLITRTEQVVVSAVPADIAGTPQVAHSNAMLAFCSTASDRTQWSYEWTRLPGRAAPARPRTSGGRRPPFDLAQPRDVAGLVGVDLGRLDERPDHLDRHIRGQPLQAHRQHVRVVPEPGTLGDPRVPRERRPHARYRYRDRGEQGTGRAGGARVGPVDRQGCPALERRERAGDEPEAAGPGCGGRGGPGVRRDDRGRRRRGRQHRAAGRDRTADAFHLTFAVVPGPHGPAALSIRRTTVFGRWL